MNPESPLGSDGGSGGIGAVVPLLLCATLAVVALSISGVLPAKQQVQRAADTAALAAADTASGRLPGSPCRVAADLAARARATVIRCEVGADERAHSAAADTDRHAAHIDVRIELSSTFAGLTIRARSRAGSPE